MSERTAEQYSDTSRGGEALWELQNDLATVSCYAAGEVDNLILGRPNGFSAVRRLLKMIQQTLIGEETCASPESMIDPTTAVAMNRALECSDPALRDNLKTVDQLRKESARVVGSLERVIQSPSKVRNEDLPELETLRSLCIALSDNALACDEPIDEAQPQTY